MEYFKANTLHNYQDSAPIFNNGNGKLYDSNSAVFDVERIRQDFPILNEAIDGKPLIWFDNASTTQKPQAVIDRLAYFYQHENSNIHRAAHTLAARSHRCL
ncbi:aminotransferase class V-fold PLP-dependent enzyme [Synechocystis sp. B12]|nr:aminotransferase class V-fold PLP-dependent enzyme [Synechocystis sp. B12]